jgi:hypothetical protein
MSLALSAVAIVERDPLPDVVTRTGVNFLLGRSRRPLATSPATDEERFLAGMDNQAPRGESRIRLVPISPARSSASRKRSNFLRQRLRAGKAEHIVDFVILAPRHRIGPA